MGVSCAAVRYCEPVQQPAKVREVVRPASSRRRPEPTHRQRATATIGFPSSTAGIVAGRQASIASRDARRSEHRQRGYDTDRDKGVENDAVAVAPSASNAEDGADGRCEAPASDKRGTGYPMGAGLLLLRTFSSDRTTHVELLSRRAALILGTAVRVQPEHGLD